MIEWKKVLWIYEKANFKKSLYILLYLISMLGQTKYIQIIQSIKSHGKSFVTNSS